MVQGVMQRTGTNWVYDLLDRTGEFASIGPIWENNFFASWGLFADACGSWVGKWAKGWRKGDEVLNHELEREQIQEFVSDGLLGYLDFKGGSSERPFLSK